MEILANMFNIDTEELERARQDLYPIVLGNFANLYEPIDFEDVATNLMTVNHNKVSFRPSPNMNEVHRVESEEWCPPFLSNLTEYLKLKLIDNRIECICFVGENAGHGYPWHIDGFDIFVGNLHGTSTWVFEDKKQFIQPYDLMFVPMGVAHTVIGHSERVSFAIGNNAQPVGERHAKIVADWKKRAPHLNGSRIIPETVDYQ